MGTLKSYLITYLLVTFVAYCCKESLTDLRLLFRYRFVASTSVAAAKPDAKSCSQLLEAAGLKNFQIGHSKVARILLTFQSINQYVVPIS